MGFVALFLMEDSESFAAAKVIKDWRCRKIISLYAHT